jgi:hypothetical protein
MIGEIYTGWGDQSWANMVFFQCIDLHVISKLLLGLKSTGWWVPGCQLIIYPFSPQRSPGSGGMSGGLADIYRRLQVPVCDDGQT